MKENRKLLKEVLKDIRHDMSDEEVLNLLGVYFFLYRASGIVDDRQHPAGGQGV